MDSPENKKRAGHDQSVTDLTPPRSGTSPVDETVVSQQRGPSSAAPSSGRDLSGTSFGVYRLNRKIAEGGMGEVYEATQLNLDRKVAIKLLTDRLSTRPEFLHRFEREAKSAAALNHPNIVQVYDFGHDKGQHYLVMEYVEGEDMSEHLRRVGKLDVATALNVVEQAAMALKAAREKAIIHRDIKPANLMRTRDGTIKVSDLGLAKKLTDNTDVTASGVGIGSPHFLAPEQADDARSVDHRADIYSLGISLLFLLTGKRPFDGTSAFSVVMAHASKPLPSGDELGTHLPQNIEVLIHRMSAKRPDDRYQDYDALLADLALVKAGYAPEAVLPKSGRFWASTGAKLAIAAACLTAVALVAFFKKSRIQTPEAPAPQFAPDRAGPTPGQPLPNMAEKGRGGARPGVTTSSSGRFSLPRRSTPLRTPIKDGPAKTMLADADAYAKANPTNYVEIVTAYHAVVDKAQGTPYFDEATRKLGNSVTLHQFHAFHEIDARTPQMIRLLEDRRPQEAWEVWKSFPENLRILEIDQEIYRIVENWFPPEFKPRD